MKDKKIIKFIIACLVGFAFVLSLQAFAIAQSRYLPDSMIRDTASLITVRVFAVDTKALEETQLYTIPISGSGVIVGRKEIKNKKGSLYLYLVLTNNHIAKQSPEFYIKTPDGLIHKAFVHPTEHFQENKLNLDLGLLGFYSLYKYEKAVLGKSTDLRDGDDIFVTGFPCELTGIPISCPADFVLTKGKVFVIDKPLNDGYQLAFKNDDNFSETKEGTSGGAIINNKGELVGINGRGKTPADAMQNHYADGLGTPEVIKKNAPLALGLPIEYYSKLDSKKLFESFLKKIPPIFSPEVIPLPTPKHSPNNPNQSNNPDRFHKPEQLFFPINYLNQFGINQEKFNFIASIGLTFFLLILISLITLLWIRRNNKAKAKSKTIAEFWQDNNAIILTHSFTKVDEKSNPNSNPKTETIYFSDLLNIRFDPNSSECESIKTSDCTINIYPYYSEYNFSYRIKPYLMSADNSEGYRLSFNQETKIYKIEKQSKSNRIDTVEIMLKLESSSAKSKEISQTINNPTNLFQRINTNLFQRINTILFNKKP